MKEKRSHIVLVGHTANKLIFSIDKEIVQRLVLVTEREPLPGTPEAKKVLSALNEYYNERKVEVQNVIFDFHIQTKPIAELVHLIYQQKLQGFGDITVNVSGGLRYMDIWFYIACSLTNTRLIHGNFIYDQNEEVGIHSNVELTTIPFPSITNKQLEFLELFFDEYDHFMEFFRPEHSFNENKLLAERIRYDSLEEIKQALEDKRNMTMSRGAINGFIRKLENISALELYPNPDDRKERSIEISYIGVSYFLDKLLKTNL